jgi:glycosyltransferase involved in cell wall biosynthesis
MRIAQLLPTNCDVHQAGSPFATGNVVRDLGEALMTRRHQVTLYGPATAVTTMTLRRTVDRPYRQWCADEAIERAGHGPRMAELQQTALLYRESAEFDVLHCHLGNFGFINPVFFAGLVRQPTIATVHCPAEQLPLDVLRAFSRNVVFVSPSRRHADSLEKLGGVVVIPHGVDVARFRPGTRPGDRALFVGRLVARKGVVAALEAARSAGIELDVAGRPPTGPTDEVRAISRLLDADGVTYHGDLGQEAVAGLMRRAKVLLAPFAGEESFGLVVAEALSSGTPVVAFDAGAVTELVVPGRTGHIVHDTDEMAAAIADIGRISRSACATHIREHFTVDAMAMRYEELYRSMIVDPAEVERRSYAWTCASVQESACTRSLGGGTDGSGQATSSASNVSRTTPP